MTLTKPLYNLSILIFYLKSSSCHKFFELKLIKLELNQVFHTQQPRTPCKKTHTSFLHTDLANRLDSVLFLLSSSHWKGLTKNSFELSNRQILGNFPRTSDKRNKSTYFQVFKTVTSLYCEKFETNIQTMFWGLGSFNESMTKKHCDVFDVESCKHHGNRIAASRPPTM